MVILRLRMQRAGDLERGGARIEQHHHAVLDEVRPPPGRSPPCPLTFSCERWSKAASTASRRAAPPWTTSSRPRSARALRSRRIVSRETPKAFASSSTLTMPVAAIRFRISSWRRAAIGRAMTRAVAVRGAGRSATRADSRRRSWHATVRSGAFLASGGFGVSFLWQIALLPEIRSTNLRGSGSRQRKGAS